VKENVSFVYILSIIWWGKEEIYLRFLREEYRKVSQFPPLFASKCFVEGKFVNRYGIEADVTEPAPRPPASLQLSSALVMA
jgi:hypothetical protein